MNPSCEELNLKKHKTTMTIQKNLLQALNSFSRLDDTQKHHMISEFIGIEHVKVIYSIT